MLIISKAHTRKVNLQTPWGIESALSYMNQHFIPTHSFGKMEEAIATCRRDLDAGLFSIVVRDRQEISVCCPLPPEIAKLAG
jgi:hypothetical protein